MQLEQMFINELLKYRLIYDDEDFFGIGGFLNFDSPNSENSPNSQCEKIVGFTKRIGRLTLETVRAQGCNANFMDEINGIIEDLELRSHCKIKTDQYVGELFGEYKEDMLQRGDYHGNVKFLAIFVRLNTMCSWRNLTYAVNVMNNYTRDFLCANVADPVKGFKDLDLYARDMM